MRTSKLIEIVREACDDKKGEDIIVLDLRKYSQIANYFVICTGNSDRHVKAIADNVIDKLDKMKVKAYHSAGCTNGRWVLLDFSDVVVHVFSQETRKFYNLERLWGSAPRI